MIASAATFKLAENRSYILATCADLLWPHDEKRARTLFWEALGSLNLPPYVETNATPVKNGGDSTGGAGNRPTKEQLEQVNKYYAVANVRREFLQKVARRDPQLALDMLRST